MFTVDTGASDHGIGAVLSQQQDGFERVIAYASRALTKAERNYCVTRKEMLAVVYFIKYFRPYLYGQHCLLRTDHGALKWLFRIKEPVGQVARWLQLLAEYDFAIQHRPGRQHNNADALSRRPRNQCEHPWCGQQELVEDQCEGNMPTITSVKEAEQLKEQTETNSIDLSSSIGKCTSSCRTATAGIPNWLESISSADLRDKQLGEPVLCTVIDWLETRGKRPTWGEISSEGPWLKTLWGAWKQLVIKDRVLYRRWESDTGEEVRYLLVVPRSMQEEVLRQLHDSPTGGHLGMKKLLDRVKHRFYWQGMRDSVRNWIRRCLVCAKHKMPMKTKRAPPTAADFRGSTRASCD